jgi:hypothetical protein
MTQVINAYDNIVLALAKSRKYVNIRPYELENQLIQFLGIVKPRTWQVHIQRMMDLGYIKKDDGGYDLVGSKLKKIRVQRVD